MLVRFGIKDYTTANVASLKKKRGPGFGPRY